MKKVDKAFKDFFNTKNIKKNTDKIIKKCEKDINKTIQKCEEFNVQVEKQIKKAFTPKNNKKSKGKKQKQIQTEICICIQDEQTITCCEKLDSDEEEDEEEDENEDQEEQENENEDEDEEEEKQQIEKLDNSNNSDSNEEIIIINNQELYVQDESLNNNSSNAINIGTIERTQLVKSNSGTKIIYIKEIINTQMDSNYKTFVVNQANNVYSCPLLPVVIETDFVSKSTDVNTEQSTNSEIGIKDIVSKGFWDRKIGKVYRVKFICQVCGNVPKNFKGYRVHVVNNWAKNLLDILSKSLFVLQIVLTISGIPNGFSEIGKLAIQSINSIQGDIVKSKLDGISTNSIGSLKSSLSDSIGEAEQNKIKLSQLDNISQKLDINNIEPTFESNKIDEEQEVKYIPINADYVQGMQELFMAFGEQIPPRKSGLIFVTRAEDFECAWVCQGYNGCSSECYKKFTKSKKLNSLIRFCFQ